MVQNTQNTWYRFVPRSTWVGYLTIAAGVVLFVASGWDLLAGGQGQSTWRVVLDVVIVVLAVVMTVRAIFGLAALRQAR
jgi:hypothetical protein